MKTLKILIVDDHKMIRNGIRLMLESQKQKFDFLVEEAESGEEGVNKADTGNYDMIIMDYQLPDLNGPEATRKILDRNPATNVLALSNYDEVSYVNNVLQAGAKGFILKNISPDELVRAIEIILSGKHYFCNDIAVKMIETKPDTETMPSNDKELSARQIEILRLIAKEYTNEEIARMLSISRRTVDSHRQILLYRLNVKNTAGLIKYAVERNFI